MLTRATPNAPRRATTALLLCIAVTMPLLLGKATAARLETPQSLLNDPHLDTQRRDLCAGFGEICEYVATHCDPEQSDVLSDKCVESFQLFFQHTDTLTRCETQARTDSHEKQQALTFLQRYNVWQTRHACSMFHATEAKAAHECSGDNAHRPWKQENWPLFCHETFQTYNTTRHELDRLCDRTSNSEAFWEGYVDYMATPTCKLYYDHVREARELHCGEQAKALQSTECLDMFQWYMAHRDVIETDCFELRASKAFYRGFYTWKKHQEQPETKVQAQMSGNVHADAAVLDTEADFPARFPAQESRSALDTLGIEKTRDSLVPNTAAKTPKGKAHTPVSLLHKSSGIQN